MHSKVFSPPASGLGPSAVTLARFGAQRSLQELQTTFSFILKHLASASGQGSCAVTLAGLGAQRRLQELQNVFFFFAKTLRPTASGRGSCGVTLAKFWGPEMPPEASNRIFLRGPCSLRKKIRLVSIRVGWSHLALKKT